MTGTRASLSPTKFDLVYWFREGLAFVRLEDGEEGYRQNWQGHNTLAL